MSFGRILKDDKGRDWRAGGDPVRIVDLFCGAGGMTLGVALAAQEDDRRVEIPLAIDIEEVAVSVYSANFSQAYVVNADVLDYFDRDEGKIRSRTGRVDWLIGGPPCQGNSSLNNRSRGSDPRNELYYCMARAALLLRPEVILIENVPGVLRSSGNPVSLTCAELRRQGYTVADSVVDLSTFGVPQKRKRHLLMASLEKGLATSILDGIVEKSPPEPNTVRWAIGDLEVIHTPDTFDMPSPASPENMERMRWLHVNDEYDLPDSLRPPCHRNRKHTYKSVYGRLNWDLPAQTVTTGFMSAGQGRYIHPSLERTLTPHEAARLQCFPDFYSFSKASSRTALSQLIGNAVPPAVTYKLAMDVLKEQRAPVREPVEGG